MLKKIFFALLMFSLLVPFHAAAQEEVRFANVQVELLPEYDDPGMLVIYRILLEQEIGPPTSLALKIPVASRVHAVAIGSGDGNLYDAAYERQNGDEWAEILVDITMPEVRDIQVDFYDPALEKDGQQRNYEFSWLSDYPVSNMRILAQQPIRADSLQVEPDLGRIFEGENGLIYYAMEVGAPGAGDEISIRVEYQKSDDSLTIESLQVEPAVPISTEGQGQTDMISLLPWLLGVLGVALLFGGGFWYWQTGREQMPASRRKKRGARPKSGKPVTGDDGSGIYCHQCGKRAASGDRFCRSCGEKLRAE